MSTVDISRQIERVASRVSQLEAFMRVCPNAAALTLHEKRRELEEYRAILATLMGREAGAAVKAPPATEMRVNGEWLLMPVDPPEDMLEAGSMGSLQVTEGDTQFPILRAAWKAMVDHVRALH